MKLALALALVFGFSSLAQAAEKEHPCKEIKTACEAAGYTKGGHKTGDKGLHVDCLKKLMDGGTVEGVTVDAAKMTACKEKMANHKAKKAAKDTAAPVSK